MPRKCVICNHPDIRSINRLLLDGASGQNVADEFQVSVEAVKRHRRNHIAPVASLTAAIQHISRPTIGQVEQTIENLPAAATVSIDIHRALSQGIQEADKVYQQAEADGNLEQAMRATELRRRHLETALKAMSVVTGHEDADTPVITVDEIHAQVRSLLSDFTGAPKSTRQWAAKNLLSDLPIEGHTDDSA